MREREEMIAEIRRLRGEIDRIAALNLAQRVALAAAARMLRLAAIGAARREDGLRAAREIDLFLGHRPTEVSAGRT